MTNPWILLLSAAVGLLSGLFSGLLGRRPEEWWYQPKLVLEFDPDERGFRTEGKWKEGDTEVVEIYIRDRVRNVGRGRIATQCRPYLVNLEEVHSAGTTAASFVDSLVLRCRRLIPLSQVLPHLAFEERGTRSGAGAGVLREA